MLLQRIQQLENVVLTAIKSQTPLPSDIKGWAWPLKTEENLKSAELWLKDHSRYQQEVILEDKIFEKNKF